MNALRVQTKGIRKNPRKRSYRGKLSAIEIQAQEDGGALPTEGQQRHRTTKQNFLEN